MCSNSGAGNNLALQDFRPLDAQPHGWQLEADSQRVRIRQSIRKKELGPLPCVLDILAVRQTLHWSKVLLNASYNCEVAVQTKGVELNRILLPLGPKLLLPQRGTDCRAAFRLTQYATSKRNALIT
jgi:hypothetical protein